MTTAEALKRMRDRIASGWTQGTYENDQGEVCLVGGLQHLAVPYVQRRAAQDCIDTVLNTSDWVGWNDAPGRTQGEVLAMMDRAIALAEKANCNLEAE